MTRHKDSPFADAVFTADAARCERVTSLIRRHLDPSRVRRVLDIGCGAGSQLRSLARAFPDAEFVGLDLSDKNIATARAAAAGDSHSHRLSYIAGDILEFDGSGFDAVLAYSTLQFIAAPVVSIAERVAATVAPGGRLFNAMPYRCPFNTLLQATRRICSALQSPATDALIMSIARRAHRQQMSDILLRERVRYMYAVPRHYDGDVRQALESQGLALINIIDLPHASLGQFRHRVTLFERAGAPAPPPGAHS